MNLGEKVLMCLSAIILLGLIVGLGRAFYLTFARWDTGMDKVCSVAKPTIKQIVLETGIPVEKFTCYDCPLANNCRSAFDPYNTDGDCLEMK